MRLTGLNVHPVKSTAIRPLTAADVQPRGLRDDRSWIVVDADGVLVSARQVHQLFRITADTPTTDPTLARALRLAAAGVEDLLLDEPTGELVRVRLHGNELHGIEAGAEAADWLRTVLERSDLRLVWCDDPSRRHLNPAHSRPGDHTAYADGYPVTLASEASLAQLNAWIAERAEEEGEPRPDPLPIQRFRPNLVIDGDVAFAEDEWTHVQVGEVRFRVAKPCDRCVMTTVDLTTFDTGKEPIRTLARHRMSDGKTLFAIQLIPDAPGGITVGDPVSVG